MLSDFVDNPHSSLHILLLLPYDIVKLLLLVVFISFIGIESSLLQFVKVRCTVGGIQGWLNDVLGLSDIEVLCIIVYILIQIDIGVLSTALDRVVLINAIQACIQMLSNFNTVSVVSEPTSLHADRVI